MMRMMVTLLIGAALAVPAVAQDSDKDWYPSKYGAEDTKGAMNNLSPEGTVNAAKLVKTGKTYALGVVTGPTTPAYPPRSYSATVLQTNDGQGGSMGANKVTAHDDIIHSWVGIGTQIDGFAHLGIDHKYYNGVKGSDFYSPAGVTKYGTETILPTATRGVLLDMTKYYGKAVLDPGTAFNRAEIDAAAKAAGVTIGKGDVVLFHTGWMTKSSSDPQGYIAQQPGLGVQGAEYLASLDVVMVGADTAALEAIPFEDPTKPFIVHQTLLAKHGVHILESINTAELAKDGATEFMFVLGQPRFKGAVQMVINPVAIR
ncbi:cyclase family protein [Parasphingorhabdus litoris]|uniref:Cyclase family protein n=1 Tax=Parasphingorhabdus litoris TaxID=394733 RepID=A0ABP3K6Q2_9SPHN|nr:cyclase family protein [Parasphingorhabdus litoris]